MYQKILVAVDGSEHANQATVAATEIAKSIGAKLIIMHVMRKAGSDRVPEDLKEFARVEHLETNEADMLRGVADSIVARAKQVAQSAGAKDVATAIELGNPADQIIDFCEKNNVDLVAIGRRGLSDFASLFLGSVSHKVTQLAPCACLTVPAAKE